MKKIILSTILCLAMLIQLVPHAGAAESELKNISYTINYTTGQTTISFDDALPLTGAIILVLNPGMTLTNALTDGAIQYQRDVTADETGSVTHTLTLNIDEVPEDNEYYDVYVKIPGREAAMITSLCYVGINGRADIVNALKGSTEEIVTLFSDDEACSALGVDTFKPFGLVDTDLLAERMTGRFSSFAGASDFDEARQYVKEFCVLELYNQNMSSEVYNDDGAYLWEDALSFAAFDEEKNVTVNNCYNNVISEEAQAKVRAALFDKDIETPEALMKEFAVNTVLVGLTNPKNTGYAHVEKLLTGKNCSIIDLVLSRSLTGDEEVKIAAYGGSFADVISLRNYIESLFASEDKNDTGSVNSSSSGNKGGSVGSGSFSVGAGYVPPIAAPAETVVFADVAEDNWAFKSIAYLKAKGAVNGVEGNLFLPQGQVTREQFVKMLFAVLDITPSEEITTEFTDVDTSAWYAPYICAAVERGIVKGISDTEFGIGMNASRQDICTMLYRALDIEAAKYKDFADMSDVADYAYDAVGVLSANGIVNGYPDGSFRPTALCTRAEAASLIYNSAMLTEVK